MTNNTTYSDLEIRILKQETAGSPVEITLNNERQFKRGCLLQTQLVAATGPQLAHTVMRPMATEPAQRYAGVTELIEALQQVK